ncbi:excinuclease ABC, C subunit [Leptotrichia sp. oral taxon 215 str. W9775]|jgi:excinuclease ABC, C subunit|uniref:excinuclease ABC subunit UvrC n=1 Tax=Leptotrichia sp. oral taxon 215 TaxID=712359 RepID=UPI0003AE5D9D|nr:excinuclease ABC subunit UvrC [Leptotrichia sp. oral taxon 215]ERK66775.1 excinuclease ABC, C subunit [Leptotrichia sp. oral taxon 215 str. W9775]MBF1333581.1 excinuclease ABC subunit UvrC [Leptotrichia sp.]
MIEVKSPVEYKNIPDNPGVYLMKNEKGKIIYVGKAKNLRNRVSSYFKNINSHNAKTLELVKNIRDIEFFICKTEVEALILENNLIKKNKPKYNILLKDEKTYPYIKFTREKFPKLEVVRSTKRLNEKADYFGPYPMGIFFAVKSLLKIFPMRDCNRNMEKITKPCLKYHMNTCPAPCVYKDIETEYNVNVENFKSFLKGHQSDILDILEKRMKHFSDNMEFERAINEREKINSLKRMLETQIIEYSKEINEDVFVFEEKREFVFLCVLNIREGKVINKNHIKISMEKSQEDDLFERLITSYYEKRSIPRNIICDMRYEDKSELIKEWSKIEKGKEIKMHFPKIHSRRYELLEMGYLNLKEEVEKYLRQKKVVQEGLRNLKKTLRLNSHPYRIECFDISNIQGKDAVAAMTVAIDGEVTPKEYRHFKITVKDTPDDFLMMREALTRRYSKLEIDQLPNLILIDGGKGQLGVATEVLEKLGKIEYTDIISIAKREEEIFKSYESDPYLFEREDETLKILQRLRDEAHRFGITHHRKLRSKRNIKSALDDIDGIGPKRKKELIKRFGTISNIRNATMEELMEVIPEKIAEAIKEGL